MTRLRQKYKNLKKEYERMQKMPVPYICCDKRHIETLHGRKILMKEIAYGNEALLAHVDMEMAHEFGEMLLKSGYIERTVEDMERYAIGGDTGRYISLLDDENHIAIHYTLNVVVPPLYF